jgi:hypothetical protein
LRPFDLSKPIRYILGVDAGALSRVARFDRCLMCEAGRIFAMDFITAEEKTMLEEKLSELRVHDKALIQRIAEARALGDLRENAEYHASREDKAMNDALAAGTEAEAKALWETAQDLIRADMPTVPVANSKPQAAATIDLKGFIGSAALNEPLNLVWLDRP